MLHWVAVLMATMIRRGPNLLPPDAVLPDNLAAGPIPSLWSRWDGPGRPCVVDPLARLQEARERWAAAGQAWSLGMGCSRNACVSLLPAAVLDQVSTEGKRRADELARARLPAPR